MKRGKGVEGGVVYSSTTVVDIKYLQAVWVYSHKPSKEPRMHVTGLEPLRLSGRPLHPLQGTRSAIEHWRRTPEKVSRLRLCAWHCLRSPLPCSDRAPRHVYPTITGKKPWSTPFDSQQTLPILHVSVGSSEDRPSQQESGKLREVEFVTSTSWQEGNLWCANRRSSSSYVEIQRRVDKVSAA